jgi:hypothetical protein
VPAGWCSEHNHWILKGEDEREHMRAVLAGFAGELSGTNYLGRIGPGNNDLSEQGFGVVVNCSTRGRHQS